MTQQIAIWLKTEEARIIREITKYKNIGKIAMAEILEQELTMLQNEIGKQKQTK